MLTLAQRQALKAAIEADGALSVLPHTQDNAFDISLIFGQLVTPDYLVWRTSVDTTEVMLNGFDWTRVDNLSIGKARIWEWMTQFGTFNPSKLNIRAGIDATWVGTAADLAVRAVVYTHCNRNSRRIEKLFATATAGGVGNRGTSANPDTMAYEGTISQQDVLDAWAS